MLEVVVLIHGLARSADSMVTMESFLHQQGYDVVNIDYPSRHHDIEALAAMIRQEIIEKTAKADRVNVISHSLGGILIRYIQQHDPLPNIGRVVMLAPPNHGSEVVDRLKHWFLFKWLNGPAGQQLGTDQQSIPSQLGVVDFELGVITGDRSINWINSLLIPGADDGKVSVTSAQIQGMRDFRMVHATHPLIMRNKKVLQLCLHFLQHGSF